MKLRTNCKSCKQPFPEPREKKFTRRTLWKQVKKWRREGLGEAEVQEKRLEEKKSWRCAKCKPLIDLGEKNRKKVGKKVNYIIEKFYVYKTKFKEYEKRLEEYEKALQSGKIREGQKKEEEKELAEKKESFLKAVHYLELTQKQEEKVRNTESIEELQQIIKSIEKIHGEIKYLVEHNIFTPNSWKHYVCWPAFLILSSVAIKRIRKINKKKPKPTANIQEEVQEKFNLWRLNMILSVAGYAVSFFILKGAIDKWLRPNIAWCLENYENTTILSVTGILGGLFLLDSYISSELKTPLQRLAIKIESAKLSEKDKKELLSITQRSNETFKETLKRFGLLTIAGTLIKLLGKAFDEKAIANFCYAIPIAFGGWQIWEVSKKIKKSNWE
jgi:hypothetical protein